MNEMKKQFAEDNWHAAQKWKLDWQQCVCVYNVTIQLLDILYRQSVQLFPSKWYSTRSAKQEAATVATVSQLRLSELSTVH